MNRINFAKVTILTISLLFTISAKANASNELSQLLANFQSMTANFKQVVYDQNETPLQTSTGDMALKRPGQFRWEVKDPIPQLLLTNGNDFWIYDIDLEQATQQDAEAGNNSSPASLLSGSVQSIEKRFEVTHINRPGNERWFKLVPKDNSDMFQWIELGFHNSKLSTMRLNDQLGTLSTFGFSHVQINPSLSTNLFTFKAPKGVEVIRN